MKLIITEFILIALFIAAFCINAFADNLVEAEASVSGADKKTEAEMDLTAGADTEKVPDVENSTTLSVKGKAIPETAVHGTVG